MSSISVSIRWTNITLSSPIWKRRCHSREFWCTDWRSALRRVSWPTSASHQPTATTRWTVSMLTSTIVRAQSNRDRAKRTIWLKPSSRTTASWTNWRFTFITILQTSWTQACTSFVMSWVWTRRAYCKRWLLNISKRTRRIPRKTCIKSVETSAMCCIGPFLWRNSWMDMSRRTRPMGRRRIVFWPISKRTPTARAMSTSSKCQQFGRTETAFEATERSIRSISTRTFDSLATPFSHQKWMRAAPRCRHRTRRKCIRMKTRRVYAEGSSGPFSSTCWLTSSSKRRIRHRWTIWMCSSPNWETRRTTRCIGLNWKRWMHQTSSKLWLIKTWMGTSLRAEIWCLASGTVFTTAGSWSMRMQTKRRSEPLNLSLVHASISILKWTREIWMFRFTSTSCSTITSNWPARERPRPKSPRSHLYLHFIQCLYFPRWFCDHFKIKYEYLLKHFTFFDW